MNTKRNRHMENYTCWCCGAIVSAVVPVCLAVHGETFNAETRRLNYESRVLVAKQ